MRRPLIVDGRISIARTQRASVSPVGTSGLYHASCACAGMWYGGDLTIRSGSPNRDLKFHPVSSAHLTGGGMSFGSPFSAPASTHFTMVSICTSLSDRSFSKCWMPTVLSIFQGGICRAATRALIERAHGRASSNVINDIGAIESGRWHASHLAWKIGATSLVNVTCASGAADAIDAVSISAPRVAAVFNIVVSRGP